MALCAQGRLGACAFIVAQRLCSLDRRCQAIMGSSPTLMTRMMVKMLMMLMMRIILPRQARSRKCSGQHKALQKFMVSHYVPWGRVFQSVCRPQSEGDPPGGRQLSPPFRKHQRGSVHIMQPRSTVMKISCDFMKRRTRPLPKR